MPYLTVDGLKIPQSLSIARFLARRFNLVGNNELENVKSDAVVDTITVLQNNFYQKVFMAKEDEVVRKFLSEDAQIHLSKIEKIIIMYGSDEYSVGNALTWADLSLFDVTSLILNLDPHAIERFPRIQAVRKTVESHSKIAEYLKNRPNTQF